MAKHEKLTAEDGQALICSTSFSQGNSWVYDNNMFGSRELGKKFTEPSPYPSDDKNPFSFSSLAKIKNITASNMWDMRSSWG